MARVSLDKAKITHIAVEGKGTLKELRKDAGDIKDAAREVYLSQRVLPDHNDYVNSFKIFRNGRSYIVTNTDDTAFWVEFGAHAGGKTAVLGYAPLRKAVDIVASYS